MSLLSKLLGGKKPSLSDVVELFQGKEEKPAAKAVYTPVNPSAPMEPAHAAFPEETPLGRSWGKRMPNEPNQFNYPGSYIEYFEDIFRREFSDLRVTRAQNSLSSRVTAYTFFAAEQTALVVELCSQRSDVMKLRRECERNGTPYLRFYYDHEGWWNARSYVVARMNKALKR